MCDSGFIYVCIGDDRMILCKEKGKHLDDISDVVKKAFPEILEENLFGKFINKFTPFVRTSKKIQVEYCRRMYPHQFDRDGFDLDGLVSNWEKNNDWNKTPFVAFYLVTGRNGETFSRVKTIIL